MWGVVGGRVELAARCREARVCVPRRVPRRAGSRARPLANRLRWILSFLHKFVCSHSLPSPLPTPLFPSSGREAGQSSRSPGGGDPRCRRICRRRTAVALPRPPPEAEQQARSQAQPQRAPPCQSQRPPARPPPASRTEPGEKPLEPGASSSLCSLPRHLAPRRPGAIWRPGSAGAWRPGGFKPSPRQNAYPSRLRAAPASRRPERPLASQERLRPVPPAAPPALLPPAGRGAGAVGEGEGVAAAPPPPQLPLLPLLAGHSDVRGSCSAASGSPSVRLSLSGCLHGRLALAVLSLSLSLSLSFLWPVFCRSFRNRLVT